MVVLQRYVMYILRYFLLILHYGVTLYIMLVVGIRRVIFGSLFFVSRTMNLMPVVFWGGLILITLKIVSNYLILECMVVARIESWIRVMTLPLHMSAVLLVIIGGLVLELMLSILLMRSLSLRLISLLVIFLLKMKMARFFFPVHP